MMNKILLLTGSKKIPIEQTLLTFLFWAMCANNWKWTMNNNRIYDKEIHY